MVWNNTTNVYEIDSFNTKLQRILNQYNQLTGSNFTLDEITNASLQGKGSGIQAVLYTYLQDLAFIESGILDIQAKLIRFITTTQQRLLRPNQVKDNIKSLMAKDGIELVVLDGNDKKAVDQGLANGVWIITKDAIPSNKLEKFSTNLADFGCIVAGVEMNGDKQVIANLKNSQQQVYKYSEATKLEDFKIQLRYTKSQTFNDSASIESRLKQAFLEAFQQVYSVGYDFNVRALETILDPQFPELSYLEIRHSIVNPVNYVVGAYQVPYNKYLNIVIEDISVAEV